MSRQVPLALASPVYDHPRHLKAKKIGHVLTSQAFLPSRLGSPGVRFDDLWPKRAKKPQSGLLSQAWEAQAFIPFRGFLAEKGQKTRKWPWTTSLGSPGLSSQSVSGFSGQKGQKNPKRTGMTSLGSPGLSSQSVSGFSGQKAPRNPDADWDDKPGKPRLVIPIRFKVFWKKKAKKHTNGPG